MRYQARPMRLVLLSLILVGACAEAAPADLVSDRAAETTTTTAPGTANAAALDGVYLTTETALDDGDIASLELHGDSYVRIRCYHAGCAARIAETDRFDGYTSASGRTYVRFWSFTIARGGDGNLATTPQIADVYEIEPTATGIALRKAWTSRWISLVATTPAELCGGTWSGVACACGDGLVFVPGAGGCVARPGASETNCDASGGAWTDDDATAIGGFCACGYGRYSDDSGSCTAI